MGGRWVWRSATIAFAALVVLEVFFWFGALWLPLPIELRAVLPDSILYVCRGFEIAGYPLAERITATQEIFLAGGYPPDSCANVATVQAIPQQVYGRVILPGAIASLAALTSSQYSSLAAAMPSIVFYVVVATAWWLIVAQGVRGVASVKRQLFAATVLLGTFVAGYRLIWSTGRILTEGPWIGSLLLLTLLVYRISDSSRFRSPSWYLPAAVLAGIILLASRQSWPLAAALWGYALACTLRQRLRSSPLAITFAAIIATATALATAWIIEQLTYPSQLASTGQGEIASEAVTDSYIAFRFSEARQNPGGLIGAALESSWGDVQTALSRGDVFSIAVILAGLAALMWLLINKQWGWAIAAASAWALSTYSLGILNLAFDSSDTGYRFLVAPVLLSLAAAWLVYSGKAPSDLASSSRSEVPSK